MSHTDDSPPVTLAQLLHCEVVDQSGRRLGHVHDVRVVRDGDPGEPAQAPPYRVEGLIVGGRGLFARLGLGAERDAPPLRGRDPIRWEDVVELQPGRVLVRSGDATPRPGATGSRG